ncbi:MAG: transporter substrate-binding domain-containing protein, partial [Clostridiales bacterium]|nr:transporter substrate-binding domain-containing protein [Clostridiales bacterium]
MKKNSLTKLLALTLCAVLALSLFAGCAAKTEETAPAASETTESTATETTEAATEEAAAEETTEQPAAEEATGLLAEIKAKGKLVVGTEAQYAPYEFKDLDANFAGCDIWLAQQIADSLGVELEVVDMAFDGIIPAVKSGQVDIGIAAFTKTPERAEEIDFSNLYETSAQLLIVKTGDADKYSTKEALA